MATRPARRGCQPDEHPPSLTRRGLLQVGGLTLVGGTLADLLHAEAEAAGTAPRARARSVVFVFQAGGPSQFETWDPKPDAPAEIRGEYQAIGTRVDGLRICEHLPRL